MDPSSGGRRLKVVVAPDSFGGTLTSSEAARAIAEGWLAARPGDDVVVVPLADGGEGTLDALLAVGGHLHEVEVADPLGKPTSGRWLLRPDGTAVVESAEACGLRLVPPSARNPLRTTTYGVGQLLEAALRAGARRIVVGLGGSATVDGGAGALTALGWRPTRTDGAGMKIGGGELSAVDRVEPRWFDARWREVEVVLWSDVRTVLRDAARVFAPQKGATTEMVEVLERALGTWADVVERDLGGTWRDRAGSGAAGGLGFGLLAAFDARVEPGAAAVARAVGLDEALAAADVVVTGEGRFDDTSLDGKVVGHVADAASAVGARCLVVAGQARDARRRAERIAAVEEAAPGGPGPDPAAEVREAARRLAEAP